MAYTCLLYHLIIRTKSNVPAISENHERDLYAYIWGFCKGKRCVLHRVNGMADHLHLLVEIHPSLAIADFVRLLKISTNDWLHNHKEWFPYFNAWGKGYCALTYRKQDVAVIKQYIINQKEHHKQTSFQDEYRSLLMEFDIQPDEWLFHD